MAENNKIYPNNFPAQTQKFSDAEKFKSEVFETLRDIANTTTEKAFEDAGYKSKDGKAGVYGNETDYGQGIENDRYNVKLSSREPTKTYFEKIVYLGAKRLVINVSITYNAESKTVKVEYKSGDSGSYSKYSDTKNPNPFVHDKTTFNIKSMSEFKKEAEKRFKTFADKEVACLGGTQSDISLKAKQMAENRIDKNITLKDLVTSSFEDLSNKVINTIAESEATKAAKLKVDNPETKAANESGKLIIPQQPGYTNMAITDMPNNGMKEYKSNSVGNLSAEERKAYFEGLQREKAKIYKLLSEKEEQIDEITGAGPAGAGAGAYLTPKAFKKGGDFNLKETEFDPKDFDSAKKAAKADIQKTGEKFVDIGQSEFEKGMTPEKFKKKMTRTKLEESEQEKQMRERFEKTPYAQAQKPKAFMESSVVEEGDNFWTKVELNPGSGYVPKGMEHNWVIGHHDVSVKDFDTNTDKEFFGKNKKAVKEETEEDKLKKKSEEKQQLHESLQKRKFTLMTENEQTGINKRYIITEKRTQDEEASRWKKLALFETYDTIKKAENVVDECGCEDHGDHMGFGAEGIGKEVTMDQGQNMNEKEFESRVDAIDGETVDGKKIIMVAKPGSLSNAMFKVFEDDYLNENKAYIKDLNSGNLVLNPNFKVKKD